MSQQSTDDDWKGEHLIRNVKPADKGESGGYATKLSRRRNRAARARAALNGKDKTDD